jgi:uncharacterized membrane protein
MSPRGPDEPPPRPVWPARVGWPLSLVGLFVAGYLTYEHYTSSATLACPAGGGAINCLAVTTSRYSVIHGVPVAVLGLVFFAVMAGLQTPRAWRQTNQALRAGRLVWCLAGVATAIWLVYAELFKIDAICLWCTSVHILSLLLFVTTALGTISTSPIDDLDDLDDDETELTEQGGEATSRKSRDVSAVGWSRRSGGGGPGWS